MSGKTQACLPSIARTVCVCFMLGCGGCGEPKQTPAPAETTETNGVAPPPSEAAPPPSAVEAPASLPDLRITDVRVEPKPIVTAGEAVFVRGTNYSFTFEVGNVGEGVLEGGAVAVSIDYGCQGPGVGQTGRTVSFSGPIGPGERRLTSPVFAFEIPADRNAGTCKFTFMVEPDNIYKESDESHGSNVWETTVRVN